MGTPEIAVPSLESLLCNRYQVVAVYTQPDKVAGRGRKVSVSPVKQTALNWKIPVEQPDTLKDAAVLAKLTAYKPDVIVVAAYARLLPQEVLDIPVHGCINIHPSLLPRHRGASPVAAAILAGDEFTGVSIMMMKKGLDTGPVLAQAQIATSKLDNTGLLTVKLSLISAQLLLEILPPWLRGEIEPRPQDKSAVSYQGEFSKKDGEIDWNLSAIDIWRRVRAFYPWPGCFTRWQGKQIKIIEAVPLPAEGGFPSGQAVSVNREGVTLGINTGDGVLGILVLQMEGKRAMSAAEFLRGQRNFIGAVLQSN
jgi:methionyl-tRNA formyltransferase